jgi:hypothetical protein
MVHKAGTPQEDATAKPAAGENEQTLAKIEKKLARMVNIESGENTPALV